MIYNKIKKANLLRKTALEAAQAGAKGTGIDLNKKQDESSSPITFSASPFKDTVNGDPNELVSYKGKKYTLEQLKKFKASEANNPPELKAADGEYSDMTPGYKKFIEGLIGKGHTAQQLIEGRYLSEEGTGAFTFPGLPTSGGSETVSSNITPVMETNTKPAEQTYNMDFKNSENANWAEGAQRRGTRRAERRAQRDLDIYSGEKRSGFLGLGGKKNKGKLSANVIAAAEKTGLKAKKLKEMGLNVDDKGSITGDSDQNVTEQMRSRATNLSMNKYNQGLNEFNYKPGSSTTEHANADGSERVVTDEDLKTKTTTLPKKGYKGKNAKAFKNKSGRGVGY